MTDVREAAAVLALVQACKAARVKWHAVAALVEEAESAMRLIEGEWTGSDAMDPRVVRDLVSKVDRGLIDEYAELVASLEQSGVQTLSILDRRYPANLRQVFNRPPVLFVRGELYDHDERAVAVVGTREASPDGRRQAHRLAGELARRGVTVLSGLARGIDTAAHEGTLDAGGRTIAVMGTGLNHIYPPENEGLAERIVAEGGALVSQFMPNFRPTRWSFPLRNAVMSGMAIGTAVVEAGPTSGAKIQAELALEHGKRLFLVDSLVSSQPWAREFARHPGAVVVRSVDEILVLVESLTAPVRTLSL